MEVQAEREAAAGTNVEAAPAPELDRFAVERIAGREIAPTVPAAALIFGIAIILAGVAQRALFPAQRWPAGVYLASGLFLVALAPWLRRNMRPEHVYRWIWFIGVLAFASAMINAFVHEDPAHSISLSLSLLVASIMIPSRRLTYPWFALDSLGFTLLVANSPHGADAWAPYIVAYLGALVVAAAVLEHRIEVTRRVLETNARASRESQRAERELVRRTHAMQLLERSEERLRDQLQTLGDLASSPSLASGRAAAFVPEALQAITECTGAQRAGWWAIEGRDARRIERHSWDAEHGYSTSVVSDLFAPEESAQLIEAFDKPLRAIRPERVRHPQWDAYLERFGVRSSLYAPVRAGGVFRGFVTLEVRGDDRAWSTDEFHFVGSVADLLAAMIQTAERDELEARIEHSEQLERLATMAGGIAHTLNNLLTAIIGSGEVAAASLEDDDSPRARAARQAIRDGLEASNEVAEVVSQLLVAAGEAPTDLQRVDLDALARSVARTRDAAIRVECKGDVPPTIDGDPQRIEQAVHALLANAIAASDATGEICVRSGVGANRVDGGVHRLGEPVAGGTAWVEVEDRGNGMDPETIQRIFDPFFSTEFVGRGLGLASVRGVMHAHQGNIEIESRTGVGTRIRLHFPLGEAEAATASTPRVLVVDDEPSVLLVASRMLEASGYTVEGCGGFDEALERCADQDAWAAAVVDVTLGDRCGVELAEQLRRERPELPVVLMSGYDDQSVRRAAAGGIGFVRKPFDRQTLATIVDRTIHG